MKKTFLSLSLAAVCIVGTAVAQTSSIKHVLLISVDGMHAVDFLNCANGISTVNNNQPYCPAMASLGLTGLNYVAASTSKPSDSFPGLTAIVTGGSPALTGVYYDVAYSRDLDAPAKTTGNGLAAGPCTPMGRPLARRPSMKKASTSIRPSSTAALPVPPTSTAASIPSILRSWFATPAMAARRFTRGNSSAPTASSASFIRTADTPLGPTSTRPTPPSPRARGQGRLTISMLRKLTPTSFLFPESPHRQASLALPFVTRVRTSAPGLTVSTTSSATTR